MAAPLEQNIREAVMQYIAGQVPLREFQEWFASRAWDVGAESKDLQQLVNEIDLLLAEFSNGHWTEAELRSRLQQYRRVVQPIQTSVGGVLWSASSWPPAQHPQRGEITAPYVYVATSGTHDGHARTMTYPGAVEPAPSPKVESSSLAA